MRASVMTAIGFGLVWAATPAWAQDGPAIDSAQLMADVRFLADDALAGRAPATEGSAKARAHIIARLEALGVAPLDGAAGYAQPFETAPRGEPVDAAPITAVNVLGVIPGSDPDGHVIVLSAHYDHLGVVDGAIYNGADDNASGTAGLLAIAEALTAAPPRHNVVLAFFDAEELGLRGAAAFMDSHVVERGAMALNINLDMVARGDRGELYVAGTYHTPALEPLVDAVAADAPVTLLKGHDRPELGPDDWTRASDHGVFHLAGVPFLYFGVEDHADYHKPSDDAARIPADFFAGAVETVLMTLRAADADLDALAPDAAAP